LAATALLAGCAGGPRPRAGYDVRVDPLDAIDPSRLAGRRIALDPGHGGFFRGALGVRGLSEAEVNLGVALELAALLRARGAEVLLTRETDRDFLTPADSTLRSDLAERVRIANAFRPDLFVSIHHNADARGAHDVNEVQVYYQLGDEGPALEAAADVHRFLTRNLGIGTNRLIPGNFAVLRGSEAPALLTESSYITYPPTEAKLRREEARRLEAEALYLGIAAFFSRRAPVIEKLEVSLPTGTWFDSVSTSGHVKVWAAIRGPYDVVTMQVDGVPVEPQRKGHVLIWNSALPLAAGPHEATLQVRFAGEGSSRRARRWFEVKPVPESLTIDLPDQLPWDGRQTLGVRIGIFSREGVRVRDSLRVRVQQERTGRLTPSDTVVTLRDGVAWAYFRPIREPLSLRRTPEPSSDALRAAVLDSLPGSVGLRARLALPISPDRRTTATFFALGMPEGRPLRDAVGTREPEPRVQWINRDGFVRGQTDPRLIGRGGFYGFHTGREGRRVEAPRVSGVPDLPGYRIWDSDSLPYARFVAIAGGALHGRRIVVDPAGGGDDPAGTSASGGRGATLNLEAARMLAAMLEAAGAEVRMTRTSDAPVPELERVRISETFRTDRYVRIGHPAAPARLGHYFSSAAGRRWGENLAAIAAELGLPRPSVGDDAQYPIAQTSATALYVALGRVDQGDSLGGFDPARLRAEAYAIYLSLARQWSPDADWPMDSLRVLDASGRPLPRSIVRLGGALVLQTDPLGRIRFARTEPGPMLVEVEEGHAGWRRVLLDSDRGVDLTGPGSP